MLVTLTLNIVKCQALVSRDKYGEAINNIAQCGLQILGRKVAMVDMRDLISRENPSEAASYHQMVAAHRQTASRVAAACYLLFLARCQKVGQSGVL